MPGLLFSSERISDRAAQYAYAGESRDAACEAHKAGSNAQAYPGCGETEHDTGDMEQSGGGDETGAIGKPGGVFRHFGSVSMAVEHRKKANKQRCRDDGRSQFKRDGKADHNHRKGDANFDERHVDAGDAERTADDHHADESAGDQPKRPTTHLEGEDADKHHREDMIESANRMGKSVSEAAGSGGTDMRVREGRVKHCGEYEGRS